MAVERELLWKAYPEGYLAMRGASTLGGRLFLEPESGKGDSYHYQKWWHPKHGALAD